MSEPSGPEAWKRAWDLLEQAFETQVQQVGDPWASEPRVVSVLDTEDRAHYIAAAQAYATLAVAAGVHANRYIGPERQDGGHDIYIPEASGNLDRYMTREV